MNAIEIEQAITDLAEQPFDPAEFPYAFLEAFGNKATTIKRLRAGASNRPCFITDGPPSNDLTTPPHRTMNLPQILAGLIDDELANWPSVLSKGEFERRRAGQHRPV